MDTEKQVNKLSEDELINILLSKNLKVESELQVV